MTFIEADDDDTLLLDEFNHRLFNTLQVISSSVHQCVRETTPEALHASLSDLGMRIGSLSALHKLLATKPIDGLQIHCMTLCQLLVRAFGAQNVTPWVKMEEPFLSPAKEQRIALATVELATNVLKHSLVGELVGTFWIELRATPLGAELTASDSRRQRVQDGFAPSRILASIAKSLQGEAFVEDRDGFTSGIRFPLDRPIYDRLDYMPPPRFNVEPVLYI